MVKFFCEDTGFKLKEKRKISAWLKAVAQSDGFRIGELNYIFCSDEYLLDINRKFLGHDYYTDIITFDNSEDYFIEKGREGVSGDVYISVDTVKANGSEYGDGFDREILRVIAHGLLHLTCYDDVTDSLSKKMRKAEDKALKLFDSMGE